MAADRAISRRPSRLLVSASLLALAFSLCIAPMAFRPAPAHAYGNVDAHPEINSQAIQRYLNRALLDEWLTKTSLDGQKTLGLAVTELGLLQIKEENKEMTVAEWLAHGGMSADEPELPASFRHFYDPLKNSGVHYLTDHIDDLISYGGIHFNTLLKIAGYFLPPLDTENPKVDAKSWGLTHPDNRYSYAMAIKYFRNALGAPVALDSYGQPRQHVPEYGLAWRAVGETMHMIADMTVPAHVRNDSHPDVNIYVTKIGNPDPYESTMGRHEILNNSSGTPSPSINYEAANLADLMHSVALWTNANFYSGDTIQRIVSSTTQNGEPAYPSPALTEPEKGYYYREIDGQKAPILATSLLAKLQLLTPAPLDLPWGTINWTVLQSQRALLVPTAIEASSRVLDNFLPRLMAESKVEQTGAENFTVKGQLIHKATSVWPTAPQINNGAMLRYKPKGSDKVEIIWLPSESYLSGNRIEHKMEVPQGGIVTLQWDLGGYVIKSDPVVLGGVELDVITYHTENALAGQEIQAEAIVTDIPAHLKTMQIVWTMGDGSSDKTETIADAPGGARHEIEHIYEQPGEYTIKVRVLHPQTGDPLAEVTRLVVVRQVKVQIYPNRITGRIGFPVEASCLPSANQYRYEWVFGDGQTLAEGKSVVQHIYETAGTYDLTVKVYDKFAEPKLLAQDTIKVEITGHEAECPLCGNIHGPLEREDTALVTRFRDGDKQLQCVWYTYWDEAKTKLREEIIYVDGKREGLSIDYHDNGNKKYERTYQAGVENGIRREYSNNGNLCCEREYRNGRHDGIYVGYMYSMPGHKRFEGTVVYFADTNQILNHGHWISYDLETGVKSAEGNYERGKKVGTWKEYHARTGELEGEGKYVNDKRDGPWVHYDKTGQFKATGVYGGDGGHRQGIWTEEVSFPAVGYYKGEYVNGRKVGTWTLYYPDGRASQWSTTYK